MKISQPSTLLRSLNFLALFLTVSLQSASAEIAPPLSQGSDRQETHPADILKGEYSPADRQQIDLADEHFRNRKDKNRAEQSLKIFRELYKKHPQSAEIGFRLARSLYFVGIRLTTDQNEKIRLFEEGIQIGNAAIQSDPQCSACYFWLAINHALYGETVGVFTMASKIKTIRRYLKQSLTLDPSYAWGGAHRLLGLIDQKLPWVLGGSKSDARKHFQLAIKSAPDEPLNYLFMARLLLDKYADPKAALSIAKKGLTVPPPQYHRLEAQDALVELHEFVKKHSQ